MMLDITPTPTLLYQFDQPKTLLVANKQQPDYTSSEKQCEGHWQVIGGPVRSGLHSNYSQTPLGRPMMSPKGLSRMIFLTSDPQGAKECPPTSTQLHQSPFTKLWGFKNRGRMAGKWGHKVGQFEKNWLNSYSITTPHQLQPSQPPGNWPFCRSIQAT